MFVGENAANWDEDDKGEHDEIKEDDEGFLLDVFGQSNGGTEKDSSSNHGVGGGEAGLTRAVGTDVPDEDVVEKEINNYHQR